MRKGDIITKIFSVFLMCTIISNVFAYNSMAALDIKYEDFSGDNLLNWTLTTGKRDGDVLQIPPSSDTEWQTWKLPRPYPEGDVVVEYDFKSESDKANVFIQNPNGGSVCRLQQRGNALRLQHSKDGTENELTLLTDVLFEKGVWYHFKHVINYSALPSATKSSVYMYDMNGKLLCSVKDKIYMDAHKYTSPSDLRVVLVQNIGSGGNVYLDNFSVYEGTDVYLNNPEYYTEGKTITVTGEVSGCEKPIVVSAIYDENVLKSVKLENNNNFQLRHDNIDFQGYTAKLFVFNSAENLEPKTTVFCTDEREMKTYSTISDRARLLVESYKKRPFPDPEGTSDADIGKIGYALSLLYFGEEIDKANILLSDCLDNVDASKGEQSGIYFQMSILQRIYNCYNDFLTGEVKEKIKNFFFVYLDTFDDYSFTENEFSHYNDVFLMEGTGNHHVIRRMAYLLGSQILKNSSDYKEYVFADGKNMNEHYNAWLNYWIDEIKYRMEYAPEIEYFSSGYGKYTMDVFMTLYDCVEDARLKTLCEKYLDYIMTEMTVLSTNGIFGGARGRSVRTTESNEIADFYLNMIYFNHNAGWRLNGSFDVVTGEILNNSNNQTCHPNLMSLAASSYRPPYILTDIALSKREPYEYVSYPIGRGERSTEHSGYFSMLYPSRYMRYSYITDEYTVGSMTYDRTLSYTEIQQQNRYVGIHFKNSENNSELLRVYPDTERNYSRGFNDINAAASGSAMLVSSLPEAKYYNPDLHRDIKMYVAKSFYNNHIMDDGWMFSHTNDGEGYIAIKPSKGKISGWLNESNRSYLLFDEVNVPVIMQAGSKLEHGSFENFVSEVKQTEFGWENEKEFVYQPVCYGKKLTFYTDKSVHLVGGNVAELECSYLTKSPYLVLGRGSGKVHIQNTHNNSFILDFNSEE